MATHAWQKIGNENACFYEIGDHAVPARTLLIIPCSGKKAGGSLSGHSTRLTNVISNDLGCALVAARQRLSDSIQLEERFLCPAWKRYSGSLYTSGNAGLKIAISAGFPTMIISGGYGLLLAEEPIGTYNKMFQVSDWPRGLLEEILIGLVADWKISSVRAFASSTTGYGKLLLQVPWSRSNVKDAWLISPETSTGAMIKSPRAQGEALTAMMLGTLHHRWKSSDGLGLIATQLR